MAFLGHVIAQASGGRCQPWTEEIRYMKGRGMRKENKEAEEGRKGAGGEGGGAIGAGIRMAFSSNFLWAASKGHLSIKFHMVVQLSTGGRIRLLKGSSCAHPAFFSSYCMSTPADNV